MTRKAKKAPKAEPAPQLTAREILAIMELTDSSTEEKRERLYTAIQNAQQFMHKSASPDEIMSGIRRWFPEPAFFIEAGRQATAKTGLSQLDGFYYAMIPSLARTCLSQQWGAHPDLSTVSKMARYLRTLYIGIHIECFYLVMLNGQGRLIRSVLLQKGGVDSAPFYLGQVLTTALSEGAKFIVLAHNHPGGTRMPSQEDLRCTLRALYAVEPLCLPLLDHIIVVPDGVVSIREVGMVPRMLWNMVCEDTRIGREWLDMALLVD